MCIRDRRITEALLCVTAAAVFLHGDLELLVNYWSKTAGGYDVTFSDARIGVFNAGGYHKNIAALFFGVDVFVLAGF